MFNKAICRIGFACKFVEVNKKGEMVSVPHLNTGTTTYAWANRQPDRSKVEDRLLSIARTNAQNTHNLIKKIAALTPGLRMLRLTSDMLPLYTHREYRDFWLSTDVQTELSRLFAPLGETARNGDVRLSFHPGQFCVLASDRPETVQSSIEEFEYHVDMARWMGYGKQFQDFKINIHIAGKQGPQGIIAALNRLTPEARNCLTIENDEISFGLESSLELKDHVALVLDIHHHWVKTGEYISSDDDRIKQVIESWRGVRPVIHYSVSREDGQIDQNTDTLHDMQKLIESGYNKQKLRAHSDYYYNHAVNQWAYTHWQWSDMLCESKAKNIASMRLYDIYSTYAKQTKELICETT